MSNRKMDGVSRRKGRTAWWLMGAGLLVVTAIVLAGVIGVKTTTAQVSGATYTGTTEQGAEVSLTVNADGTAVTEFSFGSQQKGAPLGIQGPCISFSFSVSGPGVPITNGSFTHTSSTDPQFDRIVNGTFSDAQVAGTIALVFPGDPSCDTGDISWSATTEAALAATSTPPPPAPTATATTAAATSEPGLPVTGRSGGSGSTSDGVLWATLAGTAGAFVLAAAGFAVMRRRMA